MSALLIEHRTASGSTKRWKLASKKQGVHSYGSSKEADLSINDPHLNGIQGYFEFRNDKWIYVSLDDKISTSPIEVVIETSGRVTLAGSSLSFRRLETRTDRLENIFSHALEQKPGTRPYRAVVKTHHGHLLEVIFRPEGKTAVNDWQESEQAGIIVRERTVFLSKAEFVGFQKQTTHSGQTKQIVAVTGILAGLLGALFLFSPSREFSEVAEFKMSSHEVVTVTKFKPPQPKPAPAQAQAQTQAPTNHASSHTATTVKENALAAFSQSRISKLLGKLSIGSAKSVNAVAAVGTEAGAGPGLSVVGKNLRSGKDWSSEGKGSILGASTVGSTGAAAGLGQISAGKAGSGGGVNIADEGTEVIGGLDREVIAQYVRSQLGQILYCYERALSAKPDLFGKVSVNFVIGGLGQIETRAIRENTLRNAAVEDCMLQRISQWKFPAPQGGTRVVVTYPFLFKSTN